MIIEGKNRPLASTVGITVTLAFVLAASAIARVWLMGMYICLDPISNVQQFHPSLQFDAENIHQQLFSFGKKTILLLISANDKTIFFSDVILRRPNFILFLWNHEPCDWRIAVLLIDVILPFR